MHKETTGPRLLERLAQLIEYPDDQIGEHLESCLGDLRSTLPEAEALLAEWKGYVEATPVCSVEELYTQSFEINPVCALDVGYYLFGEDYQRGLFLAHLRENQEEVGLTNETELPDHLPVLLRWLGRVHGSELHTEMAAECLLPVLRRMDDSLARTANPYRGVLQAIALVLERDLLDRGIALSEAETQGAAFRTPSSELAGVPVFSQADVG
jgi:nitrate reductase delta subunit